MNNESLSILNITYTSNLGDLESKYKPELEYWSFVKFTPYLLTI